MNKIDKFIKKLIPKERATLLQILEQILKNNLSGLDIKKLKGYDNYFRVRKGNIRIIFHLDINARPVIKEIDWRNENTY